MGLKVYPLSVMLDIGKLVLCFWVIQILSNMYYIQISASGSFPANPSLNPDVSSILLPRGPLCLCWARHWRTQIRRTAGAGFQCVHWLVSAQFPFHHHPWLKNKRVSNFHAWKNYEPLPHSPTKSSKHQRDASLPTNLGDEGQNYLLD